MQVAELPIKQKKKRDGSLPKLIHLVERPKKLVKSVEHKANDWGI
jgi:hypothetical protein